MRLPRPSMPRVAAYVLAAMLGLAFADSVFRIPVQVSDSLDAIVEAARAPSTTRLLVESSRWSVATLRPVRYVQARALLRLADAARLSYSAVFRGAHAALVMLLLLTFVACLPIEGWLDCAAVAFCLTVFTGLHTFAAVTRESFPVNHYAEVALVALLAVAIAQRPRQWIREALILFLLAWCLLLIESAVLIWLVIAGCAAMRMPGLRWRTAAAATLILVLYAGARPALGITSPGIGSQGSGFGGAFISASALRERFAAHPLPLFAYNIAGGALSVLFSEPRFGVYQLLQPRKDAGLSPVYSINIVSSGLVTLALAGYLALLARRRRDGLRDADRVAVVAVLVIAASAGLCLTYIKDEIISTAGAFYALAAFAPIRAMLGLGDPAGLTRPTGPTSRTRPSLARPALAALFLLVAAPLWAFRSVGTHFELRRTAYYSRNDWTNVLPPNRRDRWPTDPTELAITRRLKDEALQRPTISPRFLPRWGERYWVE